MLETQQHNPNVFNPEFHEQLIQEYLLDQGIINPEQLSQAVAKLREYKIELQKNQHAIAYIFDQKHYSLKEINPWTEEVFRELELPGIKKKKPNYYKTDWHQVGSGSVYLFHANSAREIGEIFWGEEEQTQGIIVSDRFTHLYFGGLDEHPYLALTNSLYAGQIPLKRTKALPVDIQLSPDKKTVFLADRGRGTVFIVDLESFKVKGQLGIRKPGSFKTINMAPSPDGNRLYISDYKSPALFIVNLKSLKIKRNPMPYGILGNIQLSKDGQWLYLQNIRSDQSVEIIVVDTTNFLHRSTIPLKGQLFSQMDDPCDLMVVSPENNYLLFMTFVNAPSMFTPWINIVDLSNYHLIDRYALLTGDNKPTYLAFAMNKPDGYFKIDISILEVLLELGFISITDVEEAELTIQETLVKNSPPPQDDVMEMSFATELEDEFDAFSMEPEEEEAIDKIEASRGRPEEDYPVLHQYQIDPSLLMRFPEDILRKYEMLTINELNDVLKVAAVDPNRPEIEAIIKNAIPDCSLLVIPVTKEEFERFMNEFYQFIMTRMKNVLSNMSSEQKELFKQSAPEEVVNNLESYTEPEDAPILSDEEAKETIEAALEEAVVEEETVAEEDEEEEEAGPEIDQEEPDEEESEEEKLKQVPENKMDTILLAFCINEFKKIWGIDVSEEPPVLKKLKTHVEKARKELMIFDYTIIRISDLYNGLSLETVITREKFLNLIDVTPQEEIDKQTKECQSCGAPVQFGTEYCIVCASKMQSEPEDDDEQQIDLPSGHFLFQDIEQQRVIEFNNKGQIVWQVGGRDGIGPAKLQDPQNPIQLPNGNILVADAGQDTIFEISRSGQIRWQFPPEGSKTDIELRRPVKALRMLNGNTIIVDQGNHRIIEINQMHKIVWQYGITSSVGITRGRLYSPSDLQVLKGKRFLITDTDNHRVIEVTQDEEIVWQYGNTDNKLGSGYGKRSRQLNMPVRAVRLRNGNTLICDSDNRRVVEVNPAKEVVWTFDTGIEEQSGGAFSFVPINALRLDNGNTVVFSPLYVIEVSRQLHPQYLYQYALLPRAEGYDEKVKESDKILELSSKPSEQHISELAKKATQNYIKTKSKLLDIDFPLVDKQNNQVVIINRHKSVQWRFGAKSVKNPQYMERPQCIEFVPDDEYHLLVTDTDRHRVFKIYRPTKEIVWQYGETGVLGSSDGRLGHPRSATASSAHTVLITDQYSGRVIEVNKTGEVVWSYGGWDTGINPLNAPYYAQKTPDNTILITDWSNHYVIEVDRKGEIIWQFGTLKNPGKSMHQLMYPERAIRLENSHTLIVDTRNHRVLEVDPAGGIFWEFGGLKARKAFKKITNPTAAYRLDDGHTLIIHSGNRQVIEVDMHGEVVWQYLLPSKR